MSSKPAPWARATCLTSSSCRGTALFRAFGAAVQEHDKAAACAETIHDTAK